MNSTKIDGQNFLIYASFWSLSLLSTYRSSWFPIQSKELGYLRIQLRHTQKEVELVPLFLLCRNNRAYNEAFLSGKDFDVVANLLCFTVFKGTVTV